MYFRINDPSVPEMPRESKPDINFVPALPFLDEDEIMNDPRVRKLPGAPTYLVETDGREFTVTEVVEGMLTGQPAGFAVYHRNGFWLGEQEPQPGDPVVAHRIYPTAVQAIFMVLNPFPWDRM